MAALAMIALMGCGSSGGVEIGQARLARPTGANAAVYMEIRAAVVDRLIDADAEVAARVEIHETTTDEAGLTVMEQVDELDVTPSRPLVFEPGGLHLMLIDADRLEEGDIVPVTLLFEKAGLVTVEATVVAPEDVMTHAGHG